MSRVRCSASLELNQLAQNCPIRRDCNTRMQHGIKSVRERRKNDYEGFFFGTDLKSVFGLSALSVPCQVLNELLESCERLGLLLLVPVKVVVVRWLRRCSRAVRHVEGGLRKEQRLDGRGRQRGVV